MNMEGYRSKLFFGWWSVLVTGAVSGVGIGFYFYGISALFKPISIEIGLNRAVTSGAAGIGIMMGSILGPFTGLIVDRLGPRWTITLSLIIIALALICMSFVNSIWSFYLVWGLILGLGVNFGLTIAVDKALADWFIRKIGMAIGIKFAVLGLFNALSLPLISWLVTRLGWRMTCLVWAVIMIMLIPLILIFVKDKRPEYYGLLPDGDNVAVNPGGSNVSTIKDTTHDSSGEDKEYSIRMVLKTRTYWILVSVFFMQLFIVGGFNIHCIPILTEMDIDPLVAGGMMGMMLFFTIPSRILGGFVADLVGMERLNLLTILPFFFYFSGFCLFLVNPTTITTYILLILYGLGHGMPATLFVVIISRFFGRKAFGSIFGACFFFTAPATLLAPIVTGWIFDVSHSYTPALILFMINSTIAMALLPFLKAPES